MHVCMYACMHVCMYAFMHACMHVCMYVCMYICMYVCINIFVYTNMINHVCEYTNVYVYMYVYLHIGRMHMYSLNTLNEISEHIGCFSAKDGQGFAIPLWCPSHSSNQPISCFQLPNNQTVVKLCNSNLYRVEWSP